MLLVAVSVLTDDCKIYNIIYLIESSRILLSGHEIITHWLMFESLADLHSSVDGHPVLALRWQCNQHHKLDADISR